jgi:hypothetical protein
MKIDLITPVLEAASESFSKIRDLYGESSGGDVSNERNAYCETFVKTGSYSFVETTYHSLKKSKVKFSFGDLPILTIICRDDSVIDFKLDPYLFDEMEKVSNSKPVKLELVAGSGSE